jgi:drug/metabolite transporter (DMT)-like permease
MALHRSSGRWRLGLSLALTTAMLWATLPIALKVTLAEVDAWTITWFRFFVAALFMLGWTWGRGRLGAFRALPRRAWVLLAVASTMLTGNFVMYLFGLGHTTPANAQLLIQAAPLLLSVGGIVVFRERFERFQWLGVVAVAIGLVVFAFDQRRHAAVAPHDYALGVVIVLLAAVVWAIYALAQKQLLQHLGSGAVMLVIYIVATLLLLPFATPSRLLALDATHAIALGYCMMNTVAAYGAFAEALAHWEASRVGVVLALTPLLTVIAVAVAHRVAPWLVAGERITLLGYAGAGIVVSGSVIASLSRTKT